MARLDELLTGLARERATGALRLGADGTIFLSDGRVTYMECAQTPGVERMLVAAGRMTETALRDLRADGGCERLLAEGRVTRTELQYAVLGVILDAAFFLLPVSGARPKFRPGERHWLGGQCFLDVAGLLRECHRRGVYLAEIWPCADMDAVPVRPVGRLPGHGVTLSGVEWEVLVRADQRTTPLELAEQAGRSGYAVLLAVRRLAAAGLLVRPKPGPEAMPESESGSKSDTEPGFGRGGERGAAAGIFAAPTVVDEPAEDGGLPRRARRPYEREAGGPETASAVLRPIGPPTNGDPTDLALLMRLKKALEELS
ncbi:hypothetical protein [Spongiactinospora sp. TRM90649]|uniref:hypothetical protein n=1 Tax=Spongiactinospora sp. TRM90649 TaxID=3031114 RepID=UPI0023F7CCA6|nr:hypothetical protein [Spongiactinospora sp. TRM90649]MDF5757666.1 hypothetical protein [Spongiactinospora sp. TRM90649]